MTSRKIYYARLGYMYPTSHMDESATSSDNLFEFEESDVWNVGPSPTELKSKKVPSLRSTKKPASGKKMDWERSPAAAASLPVNIPDWSKILKEAYVESRKRDSDDDGCDSDDSGGDVDDRVPPHEYLARRRGASLSAHETLKGRDLRRVRNAIWKTVGFED